MDTYSSIGRSAVYNLNYTLCYCISLSITSHYHNYLTIFINAHKYSNKNKPNCANQSAPKYNSKYTMMSNYKYGDMVFAKCQNYPYWPGKVIGSFPHTSSYKVLFYGEKSQATINENNIVPFNLDTHRKFAQEPIAKSNRALKFSLKVAMNHFAKRKKGLNSESDQEEIYQESEPKRQEITRKSKVVTVAKQPEDPFLQLNHLLNLLSNQASNYKNQPRKMTQEQELRLKELIQNGGMMLSEMIDRRIMDRYIVVLKQLDLWGVDGSLVQLHQLIRKKYQQYKAIILGPEFASIPIRENKRQRIMQKFTQYKGVL